MEKKRILELLEKVSADCKHVVEKGFRPDLNIATIKKEIDQCIKLLGAVDEMEIKPEPAKLSEKPAVQGAETEKAEVKKEPEDVNEGGNLSGRIEELSGEVVIANKAEASSGMLGSIGQEPAQTLKHTSSVTEKPADSDKT